MNMLTGIQDTLISLDHIFIKASRTEHEAATRINKIARGYLRRKRYAQGIKAHKIFSLMQSKNMYPPHMTCILLLICHRYKGAQEFQSEAEQKHGGLFRQISAQTAGH